MLASLSLTPPEDRVALLEKGAPCVAEIFAVGAGGDGFIAGRARAMGAGHCQGIIAGEVGQSYQASPSLLTCSPSLAGRGSR